MEKTELTADLLGLRGGLSLISKNTDRIKNLESANQHLKDSVRSLEQQRRAAENHLKNQTEELEKMKKTYSSLKREISDFSNVRIVEKTKLQYKKEASSRAIDWIEAFPEIGWWNGAIWAVLLGIIYNLFCIFPGDYSVVGAFAGLFAYPLIITIVWLIRRRAQIKREVKKRIQSYNSDIQSRKERLNNLSNDIKRQELKINQAKRDVLSIDKKVKDAYHQEHDLSMENGKKIEILANQSKIIKSALSNNYGFVLNESDWSNIDLIIHYLQTRRADTLKEALTLVDRQIQTNQIVAAINAASHSIGTHINSALSKFAEAISASFSRLDSTLQTISAQVAASSNDSHVLAEKINQRLDDNISELKIQSALLEKSNITSERLIEDLKYNQKYWIK